MTLIVSIIMAFILAQIDQSRVFSHERPAQSKIIKNKNTAKKKPAPKRRPAPISSEEQLKKLLIAKLSRIFPKEEVSKIFSDERMRVDRSIFQIKPPECKLTDETSRPHTGYFDPDCGILIPKSLQRGMDFIVKHQETLDDAYEKYGVEPEVIAGILRVETNFGSYLGKHSVLTTLYTRYILTPARRNMALEQIDFFLRLAKTNGWDPFAVQGSSWGAVGLPQFMPFSYWHFAVDGDNDGKVDLCWDKEKIEECGRADAIYSVANYLAEHGWSDKVQDQRKAIASYYGTGGAYVNAVFAYARALKNLMSS